MKPTILALKRWWKRAGRFCDKALLVRLLALSLHLRNRVSNSSVIATGGPVVSLTTYGSRFSQVYLAIESIGAGIEKPARLILWLDEPERLTRLPRTLQRLQQRGLEIKGTETYGPHCKYYPYVISEHVHSVPLVTADDDIVYPRWWLQELMRANREHPLDINCYRGRVILLGEGEVLKTYQQWPLCRSAEASFRHLITGVSGVIYPPAFLNALRTAGAAFLHLSPKSDDLWLHAQAVRAGYRVRQLFARPMHFPLLPKSDACTLQSSNVLGGGNDVQAIATYCRSDIARMAADLLRVTDGSIVPSNECGDPADLVPAWMLPGKAPGSVRRMDSPRRVG